MSQRITTQHPVFESQHLFLMRTWCSRAKAHGVFFCFHFLRSGVDHLPSPTAYPHVRASDPPGLGFSTTGRQRPPPCSALLPDSPSLPPQFFLIKNRKWMGRFKW